VKLLVGLGNPGAQYETTRHNVGWMALDRIAQEAGLKFKSDRRFRASIAEGRLSLTNDKVLLVKPLTFMNLSGEAVRLISDFYKVAPVDVVVITDDLALPLGSMRIRSKGSAGGHNGLKSLITHLKTDEFPRIRIGVGGHAGDAVSHVLGTFQREEWPEVHAAIDLAIQAANTALEEGVETAMNRFNNRRKPEAEEA
jgi:peptidyl-tRNA hydrolase, PTH1 family